jgi:hypothetical protein
MYSLRRWAGVGACLFCLNAFSAAQARPVKTKAPAAASHPHRQKKGGTRSNVAPLIVGGCALFTLLPAQGSDTVSLSSTSPDEITGAAVVSTIQSAPSGGAILHLPISPGNVMPVPETSSWTAFVLMGLGSLGLVLRARKRMASSV